MPSTLRGLFNDRDAGCMYERGTQRPPAPSPGGIFLSVAVAPYTLTLQDNSLTCLLTACCSHQDWAEMGGPLKSILPADLPPLGKSSTLVSRHLRWNPALPHRMHPLHEPESSCLYSGDRWYLLSRDVMKRTQKNAQRWSALL
jgi:hypothetical protein